MMGVLKLLLFRFLLNKILFNFFSFFLIFSLILFGNQFFLVLNQSLHQGLFHSELLPLMTLKYFRDLPFIISLSFIMSLIFTLNKLYKSSELLIFENAGYGNIKIFKVLSPLILVITSIVFILNSFLVPYFKERAEALKDNAKSRPDYIFFKDGVFQTFNNGETTFFSPDIKFIDETENQLLNKVFIFTNDKITIANRGLKETNQDLGEVYLRLFDGKTYENFGNLSSAKLKISKFNKIDILLHEYSEEKIGKKYFHPEHKGLFDLDLYSNQELSEFLYRLSGPIALILMSILGIFVSKTNIRHKKNLSLGYGLIAYITYYNANIYFKNYTEKLESEILLYSLTPHLIFLFVLIIFYLYSINFYFDKANVLKSIQKN